MANFQDCLYCGESYDRDQITPDAIEAYPGACLDCITSYIDWYNQYKANLWDKGIRPSACFMQFKDEWEVGRL